MVDIVSTELFSTVSEVTGTSIAVDDIDTGSADPNLRLVVAITSRQSVTACAVNGNAMEQDLIANFGTGTVYHTSRYSLPWTAGGLVDFVLTKVAGAAGSDSTGITIYALTGPSGIAKSGEAGATSAEGGNGGNSPQDVVNTIPAGGAGIYTAAVGQATAVGYTWSDATQDHAEVDANSNRTHLSAHLDTDVELASHAEQLSHAGWAGLTWILSGVVYVGTAVEDAALSASGSASVALVGASNADGVLAAAGSATVNFETGQVWAAAGAATVAFVGAAQRDGVWAAAGVAVNAFVGELVGLSGVFSSSGVGAADWRGTSLLDGVWESEGVGAAAFIPSVFDGLWAADGIGSAFFSSTDPISVEFFSDGVGDAMWVGEEVLRWTPQASVDSTWTTEAGVV